MTLNGYSSEVKQLCSEDEELMAKEGILRCTKIHYFD